MLAAAIIVLVGMTLAVIITLRALTKPPSTGSGSSSPRKQRQPENTNGRDYSSFGEPRSPKSGDTRLQSALAAISDLERRISEANEMEAQRQREISELSLQLAEQIKADAVRGKLSEESKRMIKQLAEAGVDVPSLLAEEYRTPKPMYAQHNSIIINALREIGSEQAKAELLNIALREQPDSFTLGSRAAKAFIALSADTSEMARLLSSAEPQVIDVTAEAMQGLPLTRQATESLGKVLGSKTWVTHNLVAAAFATDKSTLTSAQKVDLLLQASVRIEDLISRNQRVPPGGPWTAPELVRASYVSALANMAGADPFLRGALGPAQPEQREMITLALAMRKHRDMRSALLHIINTTSDGFTRTMAVNALESIATQDDMALLGRLASSDPFEREIASRPGEPKPANANFPVRRAAEQVLAKLQAESTGN